MPPYSLFFVLFLFLRGGGGEEDLYTVNPVSPIKPLVAGRGGGWGGGGLVISSPFEGVLIETGGLFERGRACLI